jgi:hypothetical protein
MADAAIAETLLVLFAREPHTGLGKRRIAEQLGNTAAHAVNSGQGQLRLHWLTHQPMPTLMTHCLASTSGSLSQMAASVPDSNPSTEHFAHNIAGRGCI